MQLLDLPLEILSHIWESLGPSELCTNVEYLLICKRMYNAGHRVFLSDLDLSKLRLSAYDAERLPPKGSPLLELFQKKAVNLSIYLAQKFFKQKTDNPFIEDPRTPQSADWSSEQSADETPEESMTSQGTAISHSQGRRINTRLMDLFDQLANSPSLRSLSIEVRTDSEYLGDPMCPPTLAKMLRSLPPGLRLVHLDLCSSNPVAYERDHLHICPILGNRLGDLECVRLRMRFICPEVIRHSAVRGHLQKLIIKLNQPLDSDYDSVNFDYDAQVCPSHSTEWDTKDLLKQMILEGVAKGTDLAKDMFRISFRDPRGSGINVGLIDCISNQLLFDPSEIFCYEDEGSEWDYWEESDSLITGNNFDWQNRSTER